MSMPYGLVVGRANLDVLVACSVISMKQDYPPKLYRMSMTRVSCYIQTYIFLPNYICHVIKASSMYYTRGYLFLFLSV